jgi:hypothetical protein
MDHATLIKALGGAAELGEALRARGIVVENVTVRSWALEGRRIPSGYWVHICAIAEAKGVPCTVEQLAQSVAIVAPATARVALCSACSARPGAPEVRACTRADCPLRPRDQGAANDPSRSPFTHPSGGTIEAEAA